ncbi:MAG: hypothetical protein EOO75_02810, partial [Myxococcales bacterium]
MRIRSLAMVGATYHRVARPMSDPGRSIPLAVGSVSGGRGFFSRWRDVGKVEAVSEGSREVVITGMGVVLPGCDRRETFWQQLRDGQSQLTMEPAPDEPTLRCPMGRIHGFDPDAYLGEFPSRFYERYPRELQIYLASVLLARDDAALRLEAEVPERIGLFDGSSRSSFEFWYDTIPQEASVARHDLYT